LGYLSRKFGSFVSAIGKKDAPTSTKDGFKKFTQDSKEINRDLYLYKLKHFEATPKRKKADTVGLAKRIRSKASQVFSDLVSTSLPIIKKIKSGLNFNLGFANKSSSGGSGKTQKYGLVLKEIKSTPATSPGPESLSGAGYPASTNKSEAIWTIGPVSAEKKPSIKKFNYEQFSQIREKSTWDKVSVPAINFKVKIVPASKNIEHYINKDHPGFVVSMTQIENIYKITYITKDAKKTTHTIKIPLLKKLYAMRIYDNEGNPKESSLNNILVVDGLPTVNLKYLDPEEFYKLVASHAFGDHHLSVGLERRLTNTSTAKPQTRVTTGYSINF
jgi:hypothetical protein